VRKGRVVSGQEIRIPKGHFEKLWPFTVGQRIARLRRLTRIGKLRMKIDEFTGEHAPMRIAEIFFPDAAASRAFRKPDFLGEEVTRRSEWQTAEMAIHGAPEIDDLCQLGIIPFTYIDRRLHLLLITSSSGNRWIFPKGRQEPDMTPHEVAVMEAVEEAGVLGTLRQDLRTRCRMADGRYLQLYAMKISKLLNSWPEENVRRRRLFPLGTPWRCWGASRGSSGPSAEWLPRSISSRWGIGDGSWVIGQYHPFRRACLERPLPVVKRVAFPPRYPITHSPTPILPCSPSSEKTSRS